MRAQTVMLLLQMLLDRSKERQDSRSRSRRQQGLVGAMRQLVRVWQSSSLTLLKGLLLSRLQVRLQAQLHLGKVCPAQHAGALRVCVCAVASCNGAVEQPTVCCFQLLCFDVTRTGTYLAACHSLHCPPQPCVPAAGAYASRDMPAASALAPDDAGSTPPVGLTEPATADPAPDQPSMPRAMPSAAFPPMAGSAPTAENIREAARRVRGSLSRYSEATGGSAEHGAEAPPHTGEAGEQPRTLQHDTVRIEDSSGSSTVWAPRLGPCLTGRWRTWSWVTASSQDQILRL